MSFEKRILHSKVTGSTNKELSQAWYEDMKKHILSSSNKNTLPWVVLIDSRNWEMASQDIEEITNETINWAREHGCCLFCTVTSKKIQQFALNKEFGHQSIVTMSSDYDEAYQACLNKLSEAQNQHSK
ncbi:hypothetical protein [Vibrio profundum]|uniref:hypothetical protein n=1 Tax=Vibrio profundum TaxID=2910247 RepID=UPI003D0F44AA